MKYKVTHTTTYHYQSPVAVSHNLVLLTPRTDDRIDCISHKLRIVPTPKLSVRRVDAYGNHLHAFSIDELHQQLRVTASSHVKISSPKKLDLWQSPAWEDLARSIHADMSSHQELDSEWDKAIPFVFESQLVSPEPVFREYAKSHFGSQKPILCALTDLTARIHEDFTYDPNATHVGTLPQDALAERRGVCQDFAHVEIACLRSLGIPARYVSGYLRTTPPAGGERLIGADQSHAWVAAYCGSDIGWVEFDPTNNCRCGLDHIPIAWGRDYHDVVPIRGVFLGGGEHKLTVNVDVEPQS